MQNSNLNNTQTGPQTANPQSVTGGAADAGNSADFQQTAPQDALSRDGRQELSVQNTGEPLSGTVSVASANSISLVWWAVLITTSIIIGSILAIKYLGAQDEEAAPAPAARKPSVAKTANKPAAAKAAKKPARSKSGKPVKRRKKPVKKRR